MTERNPGAYKKVIEDVRQSLHKEFPESTARLHQLDSCLATAAMVIDHIHDEEVRESHRMADVINRAQEEARRNR